MLRARRLTVRLTDASDVAYLENTYDETTGQLVRQTFGNGTSTEYQYDLLGRTVSILHKKGTTVLESIAYTYDEDGRRTSQTTNEGIERYAYDADGQLIAVSYPDGTSEDFAYDAVGNRTSANGTDYTVNALNQYTAIGTGTCTYDADGNLTRTVDGRGTTDYYYDVQNRLVGVTNTAANIRWSCVYDVFGNRTRVDSNGTVTEKLFVQGDLSSVAAEYDDAGNVKKRHVLSGSVRIADLGASASETRYYHTDGLSSTRLLTDASGAVKGTASYKAFGEARVSSGETTDAGYVGSLGVETDPTGLLFMRNRYYSANMGRFVQMDVSGFYSGDMNLYRYCANEPISCFDFNGRESYTALKVSYSFNGNSPEFCSGSEFIPTVRRHDHIVIVNSSGTIVNDIGFGSATGEGFGTIGSAYHDGFKHKSITGQKVLSHYG